MKTTFIVLCAATIIASAGTFSPTVLASSSGLSVQDIRTLPPEQIERELPNANPADYLVYSATLWGNGERDKALFWFYVGELRYRFCLKAMQSGAPACDAALFGSLHQEIGSQINLYAGSNPDNYIAQINKALNWDASNPNGYTSKTGYSSDWESTRAGLQELSDYIKTHKAELLAARQQNGVGENGVVNGVYVETRNEEMPKDWSSLIQVTTLDAFSGTYTSIDFSQLGIVGGTFFPDNRKASIADTYALKPLNPTSLIVIARNKKGEIVGQRTIPVTLKNGAAIFVVSETGSSAGLITGSKTETDYLRRNADGDLVLQRSYLTEGTTIDKHMPERLSYTFWNKLNVLHQPKDP
ncbi:MAG TPA: hypothetical protein VJ833_07570 [Rhodanobacteraceae bacterium]|nr:hypothetical protein [Rhodanobacteraceae bacterium]